MISNPLAPNPTQLMATLRMMPDQELFQYAQIHQSDPYIFPLTFQESNARKAARSAQQMRPGQPPKVVQQDLQQMAPQRAPRMGGAAMPAQMAQDVPQQPQQALPEDQGIGQLPAQNMQGMAEGGIVGYAPGGQVDPKQSFAAKYRDAAFAAGQALGVDPGIILSQWGIETRWGQSKKPVQANNLGNIKAGASWDGPTVTQHDKVEGSNYKYRSYDSTDAFVKDYVDLIKTKYPEAIGAGSDAAKFANGLHAGEQGGYATDKNYANTLVSTAKGLPPLVPIASAQAGQTSAPAKTNPLANLLPQDEPFHPLEELKKNVTGAFNVAKQVPSNLYDLATSPAEYFKNIDTKNLGPSIIGGFNPSHIGKAGVPGTPAKPTAAPVVEPAAPTVTEAVVSDAVKDAQAKQAAARAAVQTQVGAPKPALLSAVEDARAKQTAARQGLQTLLPDNTNPAPVTFPITPESLAAREAAAAKLKAAQPEPAPVEGQTFPIEPENAGIADAQRARLELEKQADEARRAAPPAEEPVAKPAEAPVAEEPPVKPAEEPLGTEPAPEKTVSPVDAATARINLVPPMPSGGIASIAPPAVNPGYLDTSGFENLTLPDAAKPDEATAAPSTAEAPKKGGMDWNDMMIKMGLGMMAGKSPYALVNVGEAGLNALQMTSADNKAAAEQAYHEALAEQARAHAAYYPGLLAQKMAGLDVKQRIAVETETARLMAPYKNIPMYSTNPAALQQMESNVREGVINRIMGQNQPAAGAAPVTVPQGVTVRQTS